MGGDGIGFVPFELHNRKWFGVNASWSADSRGMYVSGLEFIIASASSVNVSKVSSSGFLTAYCIPPIDVFTDLTILSHDHPTGS